jgi:hypothetical protein
VVPVGGTLRLWAVFPRSAKASSTGGLAYSTVASSCVITGGVATPGDPDLGVGRDTGKTGNGMILIL